MLHKSEIAKLVITAASLLMLLVLVPKVSADEGTNCIGQYGQAVECPKPSVLPHDPVEAGIGDFINPLTLGLAFLGASGAFYLHSKQKTQSI